MEDKNIDFRNLEICTDIYVGDEALEILGRYFSGISPELPLYINSGKIYNLYSIGVQLQSDGKYKFIINTNYNDTTLPFTEINPNSNEYIIYLNGKLYGKNSDSI